MTLRDKLLNAIDVEAFSRNASDDVLLDILLAQLEQAKADVFEARQAVIKEGMRANDIEKCWRDEMHRVKTDPTYTAQGTFFFVESSRADRTAYIVTISGREVSMARRGGRIDYLVQRISAQEYEKWTA